MRVVHVLHIVIRQPEDLLLECRAGDFRLGAVDLTPLSKLTAVSLRYATPTSLVLPEQCALSVKVDSLLDGGGCCVELSKAAREGLPCDCSA